jgi:hypothetical protein
LRGRRGRDAAGAGGAVGDGAFGERAPPVAAGTGTAAGRAGSPKPPPESAGTVGDGAFGERAPPVAAGTAARVEGASGAVDVVVVAVVVFIAVM